MKTYKLFTLAALIISPALVHASGLQVTPTADYVWISGTRAYDAASGKNTNQNDTSTRFAPGISFSYHLASEWFVGASYRYIDDVKGSGLARSADIFNRGGAAIEVLTPYNYSENIHQWSLNAGYSKMLDERWSIKVGPSADINVSRADFIANYPTATFAAGGVPIARFSKTDLTFGAFLSVACRIDDHWSFGANYRYSAPPKRSLNSVGVMLAYGF